MFGPAATGEAHGAPRARGNHGFWPTRPDYHSIFLLLGPDVKPGKLGTIEMVSLKDRLARALGVTCPRP